MSNTLNIYFLGYCFIDLFSMSSLLVADIPGAIMQQQAWPNKRIGHCTCSTQNVRALTCTSVCCFDHVDAQHERMKSLVEINSEPMHWDLLICVICSKLPFGLHMAHIIYSNLKPFKE